MYQFFNEIQNLNESMRSDIYLPNDVISQPPSDNTKFFTPNFTDYQISAFFVITNGLRSLRVKTRNATAFQQETSFANLSQNPFLIIMVVAIVITVVSQVAVLVQIWRIEKIQSEILSLYALVSIENIGVLYDQSADYLEILEKSSLMSLIDNQPKVLSIFREQSTFQKRSVNDTKNARTVNQQDDDQLSEEEKETQLYRDYVQAKNQHLTHRKIIGAGSGGRRGKSRLSAVPGGSSDGDPEMLGKDLYAKIIKKAYSDIKQHQNLQAESISKQKEKLRKEERREDGTPRAIRVEADGVMAAKKKKKQQLARTFDINIEEDVSSASLSDIDESAASESKKADTSNAATKKIRVGRVYGSEERIVSRRNQLQRQESISQSNIEAMDNTEDRKEAFKKSMKSQNKGLKIINIMVTIIFCAYFIVTYFFHEYFKGNLQLLQNSIPIFFNRYRFLMLSNGLLRERIIFNNSLDTFESIPGYGYNADLYYLDQSIENDKLLQEIKVTKPAILQKMLDFLLASDSTDFCSTIIGQNSFYEDDTSSNKKISTRGIKITQYQTQIKTIVRACQAAFEGDIPTLLELRQRGFNLSQADYNGLTPLYHAVRGNRTKVVEFLLKANVNSNAVDRWGGTVLNYVYRGSEIERLLFQVGAKRGKDQLLLYPPRRSNLTENDYRLLYAASNGDLRTMQLLKNQGQKINILDIESRSPLHLAACSGNLAAVEFLVDSGADVMRVDSRGIDPVIDAINSGYQTIHEYLDSVMSDSIIKKNCLSFADGLFAQGVQSAIGTFRKKFADLQILINQTTSHERRMTLLFGNRYSRTPNPLNQTILRTYFQSQELYFSRVVEYMVTSMMETYSEFMDLYHLQTAVIFGVFIGFQVVILFWLRAKMLQKMKREVFENRGILNLIPGHVFDQNKQEVEKLIKKIKD